MSVPSSLLSRARRQSSLVGVVTALLVVPLTPAAATPVPAAPSVPVLSPEIACPPTAPDEEAASAAAAACGGPVEVAASGDGSHGSLVALPDGTIRLEVAASAAPGELSWMPVERLAVRDKGGFSRGFVAGQGVGRCSRAIDPACAPGGYRSRLMWQFSGLSAVARLDPAQVTSATFTVRGTYSRSCTPTPVTVYRTGALTASTAWPGGPWTRARALDTRSVAHRTGCGAEARPRPIAFDVRQGARHVASSGTTTLGLGLKVDDEATGAHWKRYAGEATLVVEYSRRPLAPTYARTADPATTCVVGASRPVIAKATSGTMRAILRDPDGDDVRAEFRVKRVSDGAIVWGPALTGARASNSEHEVPIPAGRLKDGVSYRWEVRARDAHGLWGTSRACEFRVDGARPSAPSVAPVEGRPAVYGEGMTSGAPGVPGAFRLRSASADVVQIRYGLDSPDALTSVAGRDVVVDFTPDSAGPQTLYVRAVDRAGNVSALTEYRFAVGTAPAGGLWNFDEGTGNVAADATGRDDVVFPEGVEWVDGPLAEQSPGTNDHAVRFDALADAGRTMGDVGIDGAYTLAAYVRPTVVAGRATAVSIEGGDASTAELGLHQGDDCPTSDPCWAFAARTADGEVVTATSDRTVRADEWMLLVGAYDGVGQISLTTCVTGAGDAATRAPFPAEHASPSGRLRVGAGAGTDAATTFWRGDVNLVRLDRGSLDAATIRSMCAIDTTRPAPPVVTPVEDRPAVYRDGEAVGAPGVPGAFRASSPSHDVSELRYRFGGEAAWTVVAGDDRVIDFTPTRSGSHTLSVVAVDAAGNPSTETRYDFRVASVQPLGHWSLDDGAEVARDVTEHANHLELSEGVEWVDGPVREQFPESADLAIRLDAATDAGVTQRAVDVDGSFTVTALVRPAAADRAATAVSIDSAGGSAAELGIRTGPECPTTAPCWGFAVRAGLGSPAGAVVAVTSAEPVVVDAWTLVTGSYDAYGERLAMSTCAIDTGVVTSATPVPGSVVTDTFGSLRVGGAAGADDRSWRGDVDSVQLRPALLDPDVARRLCSPVAVEAP